jgi:gas vesicle protein
MSRKPAAYLAGSVLLGTAIGTVIGLLSSSTSGRKARGVLRGRLNDTRSLLKEPIKRLPGLAQQTGELRHHLQKEATGRLEPLRRKLRKFFGTPDEAVDADPNSVSETDGVSTEGPVSKSEGPVGH